MSGRISRAHSQLQQQHLNYIDARAISDTRAKFVYSGHCVFKGLVKSDIALDVRKEALSAERWSHPAARAQALQQKTGTPAPLRHTRDLKCERMEERHRGGAGSGLHRHLAQPQHAKAVDEA